MGRRAGARSAGFLSAAVAFAGIGWNVAVAAALPDPEKLAPSRVAFVSEVPRGAGTITRAEFRHQLMLSSVQGGRESPPRAGGKRYQRLETVALRNQLETVWIIGQAAEWDIYATRSEVKRELHRIKKENFKSAAEFRQFMKETHYTFRDLHERVRTQILSTLLQERLQQMIPEGAGLKAEQKFFREFVEEFNDRWRARTVCAPQYAIERCSNGPLPVDQG